MTEDAAPPSTTEPDPSGPTEAPAAPAAPAPDLASFVSRIFQDSTVSRSVEVLQARLGELGAALGNLSASMQDPARRERVAAEIAELQRRLAERGAGAGTEAWTAEQQAEIARALGEAGRQILDRVTQGLESLTRWLEQRKPPTTS